MPFHLKRRYKISVSHFNIHTALARFEREASSTTNLIQTSNFSLLQWNKNCIIRTRNTKLMAMLRMISSQNKQKYAQLLYYFFFCSTLLRLGGVETRWSPTTVSTCWWTGPLELQQTTHLSLRYTYSISWTKPKKDGFGSTETKPFA